MGNLDRIFATIEAAGDLMRRAREADAIEARFPRAEWLIERNYRGEPGYGMAGAAHLFAMRSDPRFWKAKAAEKIIAARVARVATKRKCRRGATTAALLEQAARCRRVAAQLTVTAREIEARLAAE